MKWTDKFKKVARKTAITAQVGDPEQSASGNSESKPISLDSLAGSDKSNNSGLRTDSSTKKGSYLDRIFEDSLSGQDRGDDFEEVDEESFESEQPHTTDESKIFVDEEGKTEALMNIISEKGYLNVEDINNFGEDGMAPLRPFKLENTPMLDLNHQDVDLKSVVAIFQEYKKSKFMAIFSLIYLIIPLVYGIFMISFPKTFENFSWSSRISNGIIFLVFVGLFVAFLAIAIHMHYKRTILTIELDKDKNAFIYADGFWTHFDPECITEFQIYYHPHGYDQYGMPFLHLKIATESGRSLMISGQIPDESNRYTGRENLYPFLSAENLQALGGAYVIEQMAKLLRNANDCKEITSPRL